MPCRPTPAGGNEKPSPGTARLRCDPLATDARFSLTGMTLAGRRSRAWPATATSEATEAVPDWRHCSSCGRAAGGCPALRPGLCQVTSKAELLVRPPLCSPNSFEGVTPSAPRIIKRREPHAAGEGPFSPPGPPSQAAAGSLQGRGQGRAHGAQMGFYVSSWIPRPMKRALGRFSEGRCPCPWCWPMALAGLPEGLHLQALPSPASH